MPRWVKLCSVKYIMKSGRLRKFGPGDLVAVGRQHAERWIEDGSATLPPEYMTANGAAPTPYSAGVVVRGCDYAYARKTIDGCAMQLDVVVCEHTRTPMPFERTLIWDAALPLRTELLPVGFGWLDTWQVVAAIPDYDHLARDYGEASDRAATRAVTCNELRVPVYHPGIVFVRRSPQTRQFLATWDAERLKDGVPELALLRAIHVTKPLLCAAPMTWIRGRDAV